MNDSVWTDADRYFESAILKDDDALRGALSESKAAGLPAIAVSPLQGKQLYLIAKMIGAKKILEVGTLGGYSAIWLARALPPGGKLVTLEYEQKHADVARKNLDRAGVGALVDIHVGAAIGTLPKLASEAPFDLFFIDADKASNPDYVAFALKYARPGSVIIVDNVVRGGRVLDAHSDNADIKGVRRMFAELEKEGRVEATVIQTVGDKGYDGYALIRVI
ncbi:MAG: O-methyltransferase [Caulobacterales bacterium]